jgi:hypothetical protein
MRHNTYIKIEDRVMGQSLKVSLQLEDQFYFKRLIQEHYHFDNFIIKDVSVFRNGFKQKEYTVNIEDVYTNSPYTITLTPGMFQ